MMDAIGARNIARADMKDKRLCAEEMIFQGTISQPPIRVVIIAPRRRLMYLGKREV